ncbi:MAG: helix-turn-helix domain-containing protein [Salinivirgaceae bacterium]
MNKKNIILQAALELFAKEGFNATSTRKVALRANVSEGLIFRHFKNKNGLLEAILSEGEEKAKLLYADIVFDPEPQNVIVKTIDLGRKFMDSLEISDFWKLQYKIKWEVEHYNQTKMEPLELALANAFAKLNYDKPKEEAQFLLIYLDGLATRYFLQKEFDAEKAIQFLHQKYKQ